jgi:RNA polymerase sigma-B factor
MDLQSMSDVELATAARSSDDVAARDVLIMRYAPLVRGIARRYVGRGFGFEDVCQSGYLGLIQAVDRFDVGRGVPLERYAARMVEGEIMHLFRDRGWSVRVPRSLQELSRRVGPVGVGLAQRLGREPSTAELAEALGVEEELVVEALVVRRVYVAESLFGRGEDGEWGVEFGPAGRVLSELDAGFVGVEDRDVVERGLARLPGRERRLLELRFRGELTQSEIAAELGISQMHVSRLLRGALARLRDVIDADAATAA